MELLQLGGLGGDQLRFELGNLVLQQALPLRLLIHEALEFLYVLYVCLNLAFEVGLRSLQLANLAAGELEVRAQFRY